jgi:hypothetical protein
MGYFRQPVEETHLFFSMYGVMNYDSNVRCSYSKWATKIMGSELKDIWIKLTLIVYYY